MAVKIAQNYSKLTKTKIKNSIENIVRSILGLKFSKNLKNLFTSSNNGKKTRAI